VADLRADGVHTSVIGSYPLEDSPANRARCIEDLLRVGIDFPAYPQLFDMGKQFLDDLVKQDIGIASEGHWYTLRANELREDGSPPGLEPFFWSVRYLEERGVRETINLKAAITGPFTLASYIQTRSGMFPSNTALSSPELVKQLSSILSKSCEKASSEAAVISIDEPILGTIVGARILFGHSDEDIVQAYSSLKKACKQRLVGTHICGRLSPRLAEILLKTDLDFLSHEFHDSPQNKEIYSPEKLEEAGKVLSVGCLSSRNPRAESSEEILRTMEEFRRYGSNLIFTPDCGFRPLRVLGSEEEGYQISIRKLRNMVEAARRFNVSE